MKKQRYYEYNDYELLYMIHQKDEHSLSILIEKYEYIIQFILKTYVTFTYRAFDSEDFYQIALLKLLDAVYEYRYDMQTSFKVYYSRILKYTLIDYIRLSKSYVAVHDQFSLSLDMEVQDENGRYCLMDFTKAPQKSVEIKPTWDELFEKSSKYLSTLEIEIVKRRRKGLSYRDIAQEMQINTKKVDNTLRKMRKYKELSKTR